MYLYTVVVTQTTHPFHARHSLHRCVSSASAHTHTDILCDSPCTVCVQHISPRSLLEAEARYRLTRARAKTHNITRSETKNAVRIVTIYVIVRGPVKIRKALSGSRGIRLAFASTTFHLRVRVGLPSVFIWDPFLPVATQRAERRAAARHATCHVPALTVGEAQRSAIHCLDAVRAGERRGQLVGYRGQTDPNEVAGLEGYRGRSTAGIRVCR